jgi:8-oxo-dGTP pyrophosphatase MutT (NUDIX family)
MLENGQELYLELKDQEWEFTYTDHDRQVARAVVFDDAGYFYFVRVQRDDDFGKAELIETSGGGVEAGEDLTTAILRELREELGAEAEIVGKIGVVSDYYNLIHRHNINHFFLCHLRSLGEKHLTDMEQNDFHLSTLRLDFADAVADYKRCATTPLGRLICQRELPVLLRAGEMVKAFLHNS